MQSRLTRFLENFILLAIVLVLIQTFLEDYAVLAGWQWGASRILIISGFCFDLVFTLEFLTRAIHSGSKGMFGNYFWEQRGWIDFLASVPLLLVNSGPELFALVTGSGAILAFGGILNILKVVKAIRIARVLRLLRVLKIFRKIKNAESVMAQRHVGRIATMVVSTLVFTLLFLAVLEGFMGVSRIDNLYQEFASGIAGHMEAAQLGDADRQNELTAYAKSVPIILLIKQSGHVRFTKLHDPGFQGNWSPNDYGYIHDGNFEFYFDIRHLNVNEAIVNIRYFFMIISLVLMLMFLYSPHFALTISDPIHIMKKGFDEKGYNLEVRIPSEFMEDEIYRLARSYNSTYLPLKDRESHGSSESVLNLSAEDFADLGDMDAALDFGEGPGDMDFNSPPVESPFEAGEETSEELGIDLPEEENLSLEETEPPVSGRESSPGEVPELEDDDFLSMGELDMETDDNDDFDLDLAESSLDDDKN